MSETMKCPGCSSTVAPPERPGMHDATCSKCETEFKIEAPGGATSPDTREPAVSHIRVAARQRGMLMTLLVSLILTLVLFAGLGAESSGRGRRDAPPWFILTFVGLIFSSVFCHVFFLMLSLELRAFGFWLVVTAIDAMVVLTILSGMLPAGPVGTLATLFSIVVILIVNGQATNRLREIGVTVGLFGAGANAVHEALDENAA